MMPEPELPFPDHPRLRHFPQRADYLKLDFEYRPFVLYTHRPHFRSASVNTDALGLRESYDSSGRSVNLQTARADYASCDVLVGGSSAFGSDVTSDKRTLAALLQDPTRPMLNFGICGATGRHELMTFLALKDLLPPVRNIVIFSGVNEVGLAALEAPLEYPEFGATFTYNIQHVFREYLGGPPRKPIARRVAGKILREVRKTGARRAQTSSNGSTDERSGRARMYRKLEYLLPKLESDLATWQALAASWNGNVSYVLQPVIGWHGRPLSTIEQECFDADLEIAPSTALYTDGTTHEWYASRLESSCDRAGIPFVDVNRLMDEVDIDERPIFTDVCHMTDEGYAMVSRLLSGLLKD